MRIIHGLTIAGLAGTLIGAALTQAIHADQPKRAPPGFVIAEVEKDPSKPQDPAAALRYKDEAPKSIGCSRTVRRS